MFKSFFRKLYDKYNNWYFSKLKSVDTPLNAPRGSICHYIIDIDKWWLTISPQLRNILFVTKFVNTPESEELFRKYKKPYRMVSAGRSLISQILAILSGYALISSLKNSSHMAGNAVDIIPVTGYTKRNAENVKNGSIYLSLKKNPVMRFGADWTKFYDPFHYYIESKDNQIVVVKKILPYIIIFLIFIFYFKKINKRLVKKI